MNDVIQKCVDELTKETPRLDYIRGMLDTLLSMNAPAKPVYYTQTPHTQAPAAPQTNGIVDEAVMMEAKAMAMMRDLPPTIME